MRWNEASIVKKLLAAGLCALGFAAWTFAAPAPAIRPAPRRPAAPGFPARTAPAATPALRTAAPRAATPAPGGVLPAALTGVEPYDMPASAERYDGAGVWGMDDGTDASSCFLVRWWGNPAEIDKTGIVLLLSYTQEDMPRRVLNVSRRLPASARGHQRMTLSIPSDAGRVVSWRAAILQRGRPLSVLQSPDWTSTP